MFKGWRRGGSVGTGKVSVDRRFSSARRGLEPLEPRVLLSGDTAILGDYDGNGFVSQSDLDLVLLNWGDNPVGDGGTIPADWVNDPPVDTISQDELDGVLLNWGRAIPRDFLVGDYDGNGSVSQSDLDLVLLNWGSPTTPEGWINDLPLGDIRQNELDGVLLNWGQMRSDQPTEGRVFALESGQTISSDLILGDTDTFTIQGSAGDSLFLNFDDAVTSAAFDPGVFIFNPDGSLLVSRPSDSDGLSFSDVSMDQTGTYTIVVREVGRDFAGDYTFTAVVVDDVIDAGNVALTSGATTTADLAAGDIDTFTIQGAAGDSLFLNFDDAVTSAAFDPGVFIFNPDGTLLSSVSSDSDGLSFSDLSMNQNGTYTIVIRESGAGATGDYTFTAVVVDDTADAGNVALTSGATTTGDLSVGDIDTYTIEGTAGDSLFLNFEDAVISASFDPGVFIFNPDGTLLSSVSSDSDGLSFSDLSMNQTGTYTIVIRESGAGATGDYTFTAVVVDDVIDVGNVALSSGSTATGELTAGDIDTFTFTASSSDSLFLSFSDAVASASFDPGLFIFNPDRSLLASVSSDSNGFVFNDLALDQNGTYTIVVRESGAGAFGSYMFDLALNPALQLV